MSAAAHNLARAVARQLADPEFVDMLAEAVADRVGDQLAESHDGATMIDAAEVARRFNVSREYVYEHADRLGAVRMGDGPKPRLRFDPEIVADALVARPDPRTEPAPKRSRSRRGASGVELLPIAGGRP